MNTSSKPEKKPSGRELPPPEQLTALHVSALTEGKARYKDADAALDLVIQSISERCSKCKQIVAGQVITLPDAKPIPSELRGKQFKLIDKFEKRNSIGVGLSARRYELEEVSHP
jgi:hypothetical protein